MPVQNFGNATNVKVDRRREAADSITPDTTPNSNATMPAARPPLQVLPASSKRTKEEEKRDAKSTTHSDPGVERRTKTSVIIERSSRLVVDEEVEGGDNKLSKTAQEPHCTEKKTTTTTTTTVSRTPSARPQTSAPGEESNLTPLERWRRRRASDAAPQGTGSLDTKGLSAQQKKTSQTSPSFESGNRESSTAGIGAGENKPRASSLNTETASRALRPRGAGTAGAEVPVDAKPVSESQNTVAVQRFPSSSLEASRAATSNREGTQRTGGGLGTEAYARDSSQKATREKEAPLREVPGDKIVSLSGDTDRDKTSNPAALRELPQERSSSAKASRWHTKDRPDVSESSALGPLRPGDVKRGGGEADPSSTATCVKPNPTREFYTPTRQIQFLSEQKSPKLVEAGGASTDEKRLNTQWQSSYPPPSFGKDVVSPENERCSKSIPLPLPSSGMRRENSEYYSTPLPLQRQNNLHNVTSTIPRGVFYSNTPTSENTFLQMRENRGTPEWRPSYGLSRVSPRTETMPVSARVTPRGLTSDVELLDFLDAYCNSTAKPITRDRGVSQEGIPNSQGISLRKLTQQQQQQQQPSTGTISTLEPYRRGVVSAGANSLGGEVSRLWDNLEEYHNRLERSAFLVKLAKPCPK